MACGVSHKPHHNLNQSVITSWTSRSIIVVVWALISSNTVTAHPKQSNSNHLKVSSERNDTSRLSLLESFVSEAARSTLRYKGQAIARHTDYGLHSCFAPSAVELLYRPVTLHILYTSQDPLNIYDFLYSLGNQVDYATPDQLTIVTSVSAEVSDLNLHRNVQILMETWLPSVDHNSFRLIIDHTPVPPGVTSWQGFIRNQPQYKSLLINSDYVWFVDDQVEILPDSLKVIKAACQDRSLRHLHVFSSWVTYTQLFPTTTSVHITSPTSSLSAVSQDDQMYYHNASSARGKIHMRSFKLPNYVVPVEVALLADFGLSADDSDAWFLSTAKHYLTDIVLVDQAVLRSQSLPYRVTGQVVGSTATNCSAGLDLVRSHVPFDLIAVAAGATGYCRRCDAYNEAVLTSCTATIFRSLFQLATNSSTSSSREIITTTLPITYATLELVVKPRFVDNIDHMKVYLLYPHNNSEICYHLPRELHWQRLTNVYIINLKTRSDRLQAIVHNWLEAGFSTCNLYRVDAPRIPVYNNVACTKSHATAIAHFLKQDRLFSLILEDDFAFTNPLTARLQWYDAFERYGSVFDVFMLEVRRSMIFPAMFSDDERFPGSVRRVKRSYHASGYIVTKRYAPILLDNLVESFALLEMGLPTHLYANDVHWCSLQEKDIWLTFTTAFAYQKAGHSDNQGYQYPRDNLQEIAFHQLQDEDMMVYNQHKRMRLSIRNNHTAIYSEGEQTTLEALSVVRTNLSLSAHDRKYYNDTVSSSEAIAHVWFQVFSTIVYATSTGRQYSFSFTSDLERSVVGVTTVLPAIADESDVIIAQALNEQVFYESNPHHYSKIPSYRDTGLVELVGAFRSWRYFDTHYNLLKDTILMSAPQADRTRSKRLLDFISRSHQDCQRKVFIHMRQSLLHPNDLILSDEFYAYALDLLELELHRSSSGSLGIKDVLFVVFADDKDRAYAMFTDVLEHFVVLHDLSMYCSLLLMSAMDGAIISNSLLSWWGAYLQSDYTTSAAHPNAHVHDHFVVAPRVWTVDGIDSGHDLLPIDWISFYNH